MRGAFRVCAMLLAGAAGCGAALVLTQDAEAAKAPDRGAAETAARAFLASLPPDLRKSATFPASSPERLAWHYVPKGRVGVSMLELDDAQSEELGPLLATALSPEGLLVARGVMKHENILRRVETEAGVDATRRDPGPSSATPWAWRFEGHHLSINVTQLPGQPPVIAPMFVGANPARVLSGPNAGFRLLAAEEDLGRELVTMLSPDKLKVALIDAKAPGEILTRNDPKVAPLATEGLAAASMSERERAQLKRLLELYVGRMTADAARDALARIEHAGFEKLHFAWAGGTEMGQPHYYRIHGPTLLIEYDDTQNDANHIHTPMAGRGVHR
jgi:hypothetical protein